MQATIRKSNKVRRSKGDVIFDTVVYIITGLMILIAIYPMYFILIASISDPALVSSGEIVLIPNGFNLRAYEKLAEFDDIWTGYRNTILYVIGGTAITLAVNIPASFALSRKQLFGKRALMAVYLIPMFFTGGLIPTYMVVKAVNLVDNPLVMILPFSVASYYIIVGRTFFQNTIPEELWEAAQLDGCGQVRYFFIVALPLSKAVLAVIALWSAVGQWNGYFNALIYLRSPEFQPIQIALRNILINNQMMGMTQIGAAAVEARQPAELIKYASIVVSSLPIMLLYPFVQKYFNNGIMLGSVKG